MLRIILLMSAATALSFSYELNYSKKAIEITGQIISIKNKAKGKDLIVSTNNDHKSNSTFYFSVGPIVELINKYNVDDEIAVKHCSECYPPAKIGDLPNLYSFTFMLLILTGLMLPALITAWIKEKGQTKKDI